MLVCQPIFISPLQREQALQYKVPLATQPHRVVVALSGGVDSSVAAWLLKEAGHEVIGVSLRLAPDDPHTLSARNGRCCSADDMTDARQVCDRLGIPFYAIDARDKFKKAVFDPFVAAYRQGVTPIPCLACNHQVKFGDLHETARSLGAHLATGHYAKLIDYKGYPALARPSDISRDQTYYLYGTAPEVLQTLLLPLGELEKPFVRALAERLGLTVSRKPDSQEICFVPDGDHAKVVEKASGPLPKGELIHISGKKLATHEGIHHFTVGQRRGIGVGLGERAYVVDVNPLNHQVTLGPPSALLTSQIEVSHLRCAVPLKEWPTTLHIQIRARHKARSAQLIEKQGHQAHFQFSEPVSAVALGQAAAIYDGDVLLGGGILTARLDGDFPRQMELNNGDEYFR